MNYTYMGLIEFPDEFLVSGEILGEQYITQIGGVNILIKMPVIGSKVGLHENLETPFSGFDFEINWGHVVHSETKDSFISAAIALFQAEEDQAQLVYSAFTNWLYRFMIFVRASSHNLVKEFVAEPIQAGPEGRADKYTGICLYKLINYKRVYEYNSDNVHVVHSDDSLIYNTGISTSEMKVIMKYAGCLQPISQGVFLLSEAVIAYQRGDNISCVVLASAALEDSIVKKIKKHCKDNHLHFTRLGPLGKKFKKLNEYGISIPIADYKTRIVDFSVVALLD